MRHRARHHRESSTAQIAHPFESGQVVGQASVVVVGGVRLGRRDDHVVGDEPGDVVDVTVRVVTDDALP